MITRLGRSVVVLVVAILLNWVRFAFGLTAVQFLLVGAVVVVLVVLADLLMRRWLHARRRAQLGSQSSRKPA